MVVVPKIEAKRLDLISISPEVYQAFLEKDRDKAQELLGLVIPESWHPDEYLLKLRLAQLARDPGIQQWFMRAITLRGERYMMGYIGFHTRPGEAYLDSIFPGGVEFGYQIFPEFRRKGYALEASQAMIAWAISVHEVTRFVLTVKPDNLPSLNLVNKLGFQQIGSHIDEIDGLEYIFGYEFSAVFRE